MLTVACVYRDGGTVFRREHVAALRRQLWKHLSSAYQFVCLTDAPQLDAAVIPLHHRWPKFWSKIELFRPDLFNGPVIYFDLDTMIVGPIDDLVTGHKFTVLNNFNFPDKGRIGSGLMAWEGDYSSLYHTFCKDPEGFIEEHTENESYGDQGFIQNYGPAHPQLWQNKFPNRIVSYKKDCRGQRIKGSGVRRDTIQYEPDHIPERASIICFHGTPRPWNTPLWEMLNV